MVARLSRKQNLRFRTSQKGKQENRFPCDIQVQFLVRAFQNIYINKTSFVNMTTLQTIGFEILNEEEKEEFNKIYAEYYNKINQKLKNLELIKIHLKEHNYKEELKDRKKKFSITILIKISGKILESKAYDWDFKRTLHKAFKRIEQRMDKG